MNAMILTTILMNYVINDLRTVRGRSLPSSKGNNLIKFQRISLYKQLCSMTNNQTRHSVSQHTINPSASVSNEEGSLSPPFIQKHRQERRGTDDFC